MSATIVDNVTRVLDAMVIPGVEIFEVRPDRVLAWDTQHALFDSCYFDREHWSSGSGANHSLSEIINTVRVTFRERATPSMQVTIQQHVPTEEAPYRYFCEIDVDFHSPDVNLPGHAVEVLDNKITGHTTDQTEVKRRLDERFKKESPTV